MPGQAPPRVADTVQVPAIAPIMPGVTPPERIRHMATVVSLVGAYIACSAGLIAFNKYLVHPDRFPFPVALVLFHASFSSVLTGAVFVVRPSLFPSLVDPERRVSVDRDLILKGTLPIAALFCVQLVLSNTAYMHSSVAFLQMMKEGNLILVYVLSLVACLEKFSWQNVSVLGVVVFATSLTIHGELNFSLTGFLIQGTSQLFECSKIVLQSMLLSSAGKKLDVLTYVLLVMPLCVLLLGTFACASSLAPGLALMPQWSHIHNLWPVLLANACLAFALNIVIAFVIKESSAVAFLLAGITKDAVIVSTGCFVFHEIVSGMQVVGFTLQLAAILLWSMMKSFPERFQSMGAGASLLFGPPKEATTEKRQDYGTA
mmetsp:Transcript_8320/g.23120  ORF Transcript_8320/g.23120 Transcript_8320/m.23120 type:complete len:373 (-) Transcript_8320:108-1226(-)